MALQFQIFDRSYTTDAAVNQYVCVVAGAEDGGVAMPGGANAAKFMGITQVATTAAGQSASVRKLGVAYATSNGAINRGDALVIATAAGDVMSVQTALQTGLISPAAVYNVIGTAETSATGSGITIEVFLNPQTVPLAVS